MEHIFHGPSDFIPNSTLLQKEIKATFSETKFFIKLSAKRLGTTSNKQYSMVEKINSKQDAEYRIQRFYLPERAC